VTKVEHKRVILRRIAEILDREDLAPDTSEEDYARWNRGREELLMEFTRRSKEAK
jgi:hypothetical protein